jgi:hypothetical protein
MPIGLNYNMLRHNNYALSHNWDLEINCATTNEPMRKLAKSFQGSGDWIRIACTSATLPNSTVKIATKKIRGIAVHQAAGRDGLQGSIQLTAYEYGDYRLHKFFEAWKQAEVDRFMGTQDAWARIPEDVCLNLYDSARAHKVAGYKLYDTYCTDSNIGQLSSEGQMVTVTFTLTYMNYVLLTEGDTVGGINQEHLGNPSTAFRLG